MPVDQATLENLQAAFREVALRAERLQEWVALTEKFRVVDCSTAAFGSALRAANTEWDRVEEAWHVVRVDDLPAVDDYMGAMSKVRSPLPGEGVDGQGGRINDWRTTLVTLAAEIDQSVNAQSAPLLRPLAIKFIDTARSQINQLKGIIDRDIAALCLQTQLLRQKIDGGL